MTSMIKKRSNVFMFDLVALIDKDFDEVGYVFCYNFILHKMQIMNRNNIELVSGHGHHRLYHFGAQK